MKMQNDTAALENSFSISYKYVLYHKTQLFYLILKTNENMSTKTNKHGYYVAFIYNYQNWKQSKCLSTNEWISKLHCGHTMKNYSTTVL